MKKIVLGLMAVAIMSSSAVYAGNGKKSKSKKKKAKVENCKPAGCCDKTNCVPFPGCCSK